MNILTVELYMLKNSWKASKTAVFVANLAGEKKIVNLLPYHNIATQKYRKLGGVYDPRDMTEPDEAEQQRCVGIFSEYGLEAVIGG